MPDIDLHDALWVNWHDHFEKKLSESKAKNRELVERYNAAMKSAGEVGTMYLKQSQKLAEMMEKDKGITEAVKAGENNVNAQAQLMLSEKDKEIEQFKKENDRLKYVIKLERTSVSKLKRG